MSCGISSRMCGGRTKGFPVLEYIVFFNGFQNPRMPSYFSKIHLKHRLAPFLWRIERFRRYQLVGSVWPEIKKPGLVGCPTSAIFVTCFAKKSIGGLSLIASAVPMLANRAAKSGRCNRIVAAKLCSPEIFIPMNYYKHLHLPVNAVIPPTRHNNQS